MFFGPRNTRNMGTLQLSETGLNLQTKHASCLLHRPFVFKLHPWVPQHGVICCLIHWWFSGGSWWFMVVRGNPEATGPSWWASLENRPWSILTDPKQRGYSVTWMKTSLGRARSQRMETAPGSLHIFTLYINNIHIIYIYIYILLIHVYNTYHIYLWIGNPPLGLKQFPSHRTWGQKSQNIWKNHASHAFIMRSLCIHYAFIMHSYAFIMHSLCIHYAFIMHSWYSCIMRIVMCRFPMNMI